MPFSWRIIAIVIKDGFHQSGDGFGGQVSLGNIQQNFLPCVLCLVEEIMCKSNLSFILKGQLLSWESFFIGDAV